ncbi:MAG TPA: M15 family metallopeptidase [Solirubrobacteraceae bacterium]|nr:M15 family metallopeptidase [Solirubrobacteraceae bacterium]
MSLETAVSRVAMLQAWIAPPVQAPAQPAATTPVGATQPATSFAATLASATASQTPAAAGSYPHLTGDLDSNPQLLQRLETLAAQRGETWKVTSGLRTVAEQQVLWDNRHNNPFPVARPGTSNHQHGNAADVTINGRPIQDVIPAAELIRAGIRPLEGDAVHVELGS